MCDNWNRAKVCVESFAKFIFECKTLIYMWVYLFGINVQKGPYYRSWLSHKRLLNLNCRLPWIGGENSPYLRIHVWIINSIIKFGISNFYFKLYFYLKFQYEKLISPKVNHNKILHVSKGLQPMNITMLESVTSPDVNTSETSDAWNPAQ